MASIEDEMMAEAALCEGDEYERNANLGLRIGMLFAILVVSGLGVVLPYLLPPGRTFLFYLRAFSGGAIVATGPPPPGHHL